MIAAEPIENPVPALLDVFRRIHAERMIGLPFLNNAIAVDVIGFQLRSGRWSGVLITPWFINFVVFPTDPQEWADMEEGARRKWQLGGSELEFLINHEPELGRFQMCTLMAPVTQLADQAAAHAAAQGLLARLFGDEPVAPPPADGRYRVAAERPDRPAHVDRRGFFRSLLRLS
jgi:[NiFe] hydrogenase assembly HybE family chaperone